MKKISDFLYGYARSGTLRMHMPGHKGRALAEFPELSGAYALDITEIEGADSLFEANGILRDAERKTAALYQSADCCYSAGGSTLCIQAMLAAMRAEGRHIVAARTVHRAFLNACVLLDLPVTWVFPRGGSLISGVYEPSDFADALREITAAGQRACLYVTSPDYCGRIQDIAALADICRETGSRLIVDNAHGAHLAFLETNCHPIALGADLCCDSAHKMLPALTGAAVLHCREERGEEMKRYMQLFGSTSPSYLILHSIEAAMAWLADGGADAVRSCAARSRRLRAALPGYRFIGDDPLHLTVSADGTALARALRGFGIECEYADPTCLVLLLSPVMTEPEFTRLQSALSACQPLPPAVPPELPNAPERVLPLREAALSAWETVPVGDAVSRICAPVQVPCPPAVPLVVSGERITQDWADYLQFWGIEEIAVRVRG